MKKKREEEIFACCLCLSTTTLITDRSLFSSSDDDDSSSLAACTLSLFLFGDLICAYIYDCTKRKSVWFCVKIYKGSPFSLFARKSSSPLLHTLKWLYPEISLGFPKARPVYFSPSRLERYEREISALARVRFKKKGKT